MATARKREKLGPALGIGGDDDAAEGCPARDDANAGVVDGFGDARAGVGRFDAEVEIGDADLGAVEVGLEVARPLAAAGVEGVEQARGSVVGAPAFVDNAEAQHGL